VVKAFFIVEIGLGNSIKSKLIKYSV
jgi:hypothetical protein